MGRTDAWSLQLPEPLPVMPEATDLAVAPAVAGNQLAEVLSRPTSPSSPEAVNSAISHCPSCRASLSGVEQKFEKCLSCGKSFAGAAGSIKVSVGI
jgi:hypothetical protein